jgi:hypothetical protein
MVEKFELGEDFALRINAEDPLAIFLRKILNYKRLNLFG